MSAGDESELDASDRALAHARIYGLLARVLLRGVDAQTHAQLRALDWVGADEGLEQLAAGHHATFELGVFPYAGVFLDEQARAGGCADEVLGFYARAGFSPRLDEVSADHLGVQLSFMSFVTGVQARARPQVIAKLDSLLAEFMDLCLLAYLPTLAGSGRELPDRSWVKMLGELLEIVAEHRAALGGPRRAPMLCAPEQLLDDDATGLSEISNYLLTPARCGVFLSRADIASLGRGRGLARGFGTRLMMLGNLLRGAVDYGELDGLCAGLDELLTRREQHLSQVEEVLALGPALGPWRGAIVRTRVLIRALRQARAVLAASGSRVTDQAPS